MVATAAATLPVACGGELSYRSELRAFETELSRNRTVVRLQTWLAAEPGRAWLDRSPRLEPSYPERWPDAIRELKPLSVWAAEECGGVTIAVQRGDHFTLTVCPAGKRPPLSYHVPSMATPGYVGPFGPDAYITMTEH